MIGRKDIYKLDHLLAATSRTFGLAIPLLPSPHRYDVTLAYLLLRIADTLEDAESLSPSRRVEALSDFIVVLQRSSPNVASSFASRWASSALSENVADARLVAETPFVMRQFWKRDDDSRRCIRRHAVRTCRGMMAFLSPDNDSLSLKQLRLYCYYVAGIVGEMLSGLFAKSTPGFSLTRRVRHDARAFGEGLQLVNILRDRADDETRGRCFLSWDAGIDELFTLARENLTLARRYIAALATAGAEQGVLRFTRLPVALAEASLDCLERQGSGAKISRDQVADIFGDVTGRDFRKSEDVAWTLTGGETAGSS